MMRKVAFLGSVALIAMGAMTPASAQFRAALNESLAAIDEGASSQQTVEGLDDETSQLLGEYRANLQQLDVLTRFNESRAREIENQLETIAGLELDIENVEGLQRAILPLLDTMLEDLEAFVEADAPFLREERADRLARLRNVMSDSNQTAASRYSLIMEAFAIEEEYGRTLEAYNGLVDNAGEPLEVEFLRVGRLVLVYKNADDSILRIYNRGTGEFEDLDRSFLPEVRRGLRMAKQLTPPDLLQIPVLAPEGQGSAE